MLNVEEYYKSHKELCSKFCFLLIISACSYQCLKCSDGTTCDTCVTRYTTKGTEDKSCDG